MYALLVVGALALWPALAQAQCPQRYSVADLARRVAAAEDSLTRSERVFEAEAALTAAMLPCLSEPLTPDVAAAMHRLVGIQSFLVSDWQYADAAFSASRRLDPDPELPWVDAELGQSIMSVFQAASADPDLMVPLAQPTEGRLWLDGSLATERPRTQPTIAQWVKPRGEVGVTAYIWPGEPLFTYPGSDLPVVIETDQAVEPESVTASPVTASPVTASPVTASPVTASPVKASPASAPDIPAPTPDPIAQGGGPSDTARRLVTTSGVSLVAAAICYGVAWQAANRYWSEDPASADLSALQSTNHGAFLAGTGFGVLALGAGVAAGVTWSW